MAIKRVESQLILEQIAIAEKIQPPAELVEKETATLLNQHPKVKIERVRAYVINRLANEEIFRRLESAI